MFLKMDDLISTLRAHINRTLFILQKLSKLIDWTSLEAGCNVVNLGKIFQHVTTISFVVVFTFS